MERGWWGVRESREQGVHLAGDKSNSVGRKARGLLKTVWSEIGEGGCPWGQPQDVSEDGELSASAPAHTSATCSAREAGTRRGASLGVGARQRRRLQSCRAGPEPCILGFCEHLPVFRAEAWCPGHPGSPPSSRFQRR